MLYLVKPVRVKERRNWSEDACSGEACCCEAFRSEDWFWGHPRRCFILELVKPVKGENQSGDTCSGDMCCW